MKILYVTSVPLEYNSSANMRNRALIRGLAELGHEISTLSSDFDRNSIYIDNVNNDDNIHKRYWIKLGNIQSNITNNIKSERSIKRRIKGILYKVYTKFSIYDPRKSLVKKIDEDTIEDKFDLIISSSDPKSSHLLVEKLIKSNPKITKRWIQYWGDPFSGDINKNTIIPEKFIKNEEKRLISLCDKVVYVSPFTLQKQQVKYKEHKDKMSFIPIPYIKEKIYPETKNEKVTLGYFGDYNSKDRNIDPLYRAICEDKDLYLNICGNSDIKLESKENILIQTRQKTEEIEKLEQKSDILVCICNKSGTQIPGKIYHYAATNKKILIILDGEYSNQMKEYFDGFNRFIICKNDKSSIIQTINSIKNSNIKYKAMECFNSVNVAKEFLK